MAGESAFSQEENYGHGSIYGPETSFGHIGSSPSGDWPCAFVRLRMSLQLIRVHGATLNRTTNLSQATYDPDVSVTAIGPGPLPVDIAVWS